MYGCSNGVISVIIKYSKTVQLPHNSRQEGWGGWAACGSLQSKEKGKSYKGGAGWWFGSYVVIWDKVGDVAGGYILCVYGVLALETLCRYLDKWIIVWLHFFTFQTIYKDLQACSINIYLLRANTTQVLNVEDIELYIFNIACLLSLVVIEASKPSCLHKILEKSMWKCPKLISNIYTCILCLPTTLILEWSPHLNVILYCE